MTDFVIDPNLIAYANDFNVRIADGINKAILGTRQVVMDAAPKESGLTRSIFQVVSLASPTHLEGGVGQMSRVGDPSALAPEETISQFLKWYRKNA